MTSKTRLPYTNLFCLKQASNSGVDNFRVSMLWRNIGRFSALPSFRRSPMWQIELPFLNAMTSLVTIIGTSRVTFDSINVPIKA